uniref:Tad domain-containing protein n=1 Tax=Macrostomum lignano TaxID=282301 RepID=A0A1I8FE74_9PLAT
MAISAGRKIGRSGGRRRWTEARRRRVAERGGTLILVGVAFVFLTFLQLSMALNTAKAASMDALIGQTDWLFTVVRTAR